MTQPSQLPLNNRGSPSSKGAQGNPLRNKKTITMSLFVLFLISFLTYNVQSMLIVVHEYNS